MAPPLHQLTGGFGATRGALAPLGLEDDGERKSSSNVGDLAASQSTLSLAAGAAASAEPAEVAAVVTAASAESAQESSNRSKDGGGGAAHGDRGGSGYSRVSDE